MFSDSLNISLFAFISEGSNSSQPDPEEAGGEEMTASAGDSNGGPTQDSDTESEQAAGSPAAMSPPRMAESPVQLLKMKDQADLLMTAGSGGGGTSTLDQLLLKGAGGVGSNAGGGLVSTLDQLLLKGAGGGGVGVGGSPFLLPAQFLALNPGLYAAQLAQLQAAQLMLARHQQETALLMAGARDRPGQETLPKKRSAAAAADNDDDDNDDCDEEDDRRRR
jgi:hypothetical protein